MSLRGFFIWFWGIVLGSGIAAGAALAVLKSPATPPAPRPVQQAAIAMPLPLPPVPAVAESPAPRADAAPWRPAHPTVIRPALRLREMRRLAERITVIPPIPPEISAVRAPVERRLRVAHVATPRRIARAETRMEMVPDEARPEPTPRLYSFDPGYPHYSYDNYSYTFPDRGYPPRFSYFYRY